MRTAKLLSLVEEANCLHGQNLAQLRESPSFVNRFPSSRGRLSVYSRSYIQALIQFDFVKYYFDWFSTFLYITSFFAPCNSNIFFRLNNVIISSFVQVVHLSDRILYYLLKIELKRFLCCQLRASLVYV